MTSDSNEPVADDLIDGRFLITLELDLLIVGLAERWSLRMRAAGGRKLRNGVGVRQPFDRLHDARVGERLILDVEHDPLPLSERTRGLRPRNMIIRRIEPVDKVNDPALAARIRTLIELTEPAVGDTFLGEIIGAVVNDLVPIATIEPTRELLASLRRVRSERGRSRTRPGCGRPNGTLEGPAAR